MDWEDFVVFACVLLGFISVVGVMRLLTHVPKLWRTARTILLLIIIFIDASLAERLCQILFHDQVKGTIWTRVFLSTLVASTAYIFALIAAIQQHPVMSPPPPPSSTLPGIPPDSHS